VLNPGFHDSKVKRQLRESEAACCTDTDASRTRTVSEKWRVTTMWRMHAPTKPHSLSSGNVNRQSATDQILTCSEFSTYFRLTLFSQRHARVSGRSLRQTWIFRSKRTNPVRRTRPNITSGEQMSPHRSIFSCRTSRFSGQPRGPSLNWCKSCGAVVPTPKSNTTGARLPALLQNQASIKD
jgi:hypothetical protein